jgi:3-phenylpropionate/trans-cinnamate dioxygenase ferredoxin reductase subunit
MDHADVVIAGAGQAAIQLAASLRQGGFPGRIVIVGDEPGLPYQRPPLSKAYLLGAMAEDALKLRPAAFYQTQHIDLLYARVRDIDRPNRTVALSDGTRLAYGHLVLATGARNRSLPGPGVTLRTLDDASALRDRLATLRKVAVIGAGFIGLEFAAVATARGVDVTVIEAAPRALLRGVSPVMAEAIASRHAARKLFNATVAQITQEGVVLADGTQIPADLTLLAIGVVPNTELAEAAGLAVENGIVVDDHLRTEDPAISAIGDCAAFPHNGGLLRLESVQNAADHARCVAERLLGRPAPYAKIPWFWSDQGAMKLQIAGLSARHTHTVRRGSEDFSVFCFRDETLLAVESLNRPAEHMAARAMLGRPHTLTPEQAADPGFDLRRA